MNKVQRHRFITPSFGFGCKKCGMGKHNEVHKPPKGRTWSDERTVIAPNDFVTRADAHNSADKTTLPKRMSDDYGTPDEE